MKNNFYPDWDEIVGKNSLTQLKSEKKGVQEPTQGAHTPIGSKQGASAPTGRKQSLPAPARPPPPVGIKNSPTKTPSAPKQAGVGAKAGAPNSTTAAAPTMAPKKGQGAPTTPKQGVYASTGTGPKQGVASPPTGPKQGAVAAPTAPKQGAATIKRPTQGVSVFTGPKQNTPAPTGATAPSIN